MIVRRVRFGDDASVVPGAGAIAPGLAPDDIDVTVKPSTLVTGVGMWVAAGVLTHLAVRFIDSWLDRPRR